MSINTITYLQTPVCKYVLVGDRWGGNGLMSGFWNELAVQLPNREVEVHGEGHPKEVGRKQVCRRF